MRAQLASLPPLCPPKLPQVARESSMPPDRLNTGIYRRTDQLLATLLKLSAQVKVVDVTGKTTGVCSYFYMFISDLSWVTWFILSFFQSVPVHSCWNRRPDCRISAMLWTNSRLKPQSYIFLLFIPALVNHFHTFLYQGEVAEHVVSNQPGAKASSDFATFPVSSFVKVKPVCCIFPLF